jgi:hypothetical protein
MQDGLFLPVVVVENGPGNLPGPFFSFSQPLYKQRCARAP